VPRGRRSSAAELVRQQPAGVGAPSKVRIGTQVVRSLDVLERGHQRLAPVRGVEVACKLRDGGVIHGRVAVEVAASREDEQRTADRGVPFGVVERNRLTRYVREDDET